MCQHFASGKCCGRHAVCRCSASQDVQEDAALREEQDLKGLKENEVSFRNMEQ